MTKKQLYVGAGALILVALALITTGLNTRSTALWAAGLGAITAAMLLSLASRWAKG
jgi:ABC-type Fe3+-siderophore transport system permease subunit